MKSGAASAGIVHLFTPTCTMNPNINERLARIEQILEAQAAKPMPAETAAAYLHISLSTLYKMTSRSAIPFYRSAGGKLLSFLEPDLRAYLLKNRVASVEEIEREIRRG